MTDTSRGIRRYLGSGDFYRQVVSVAVPIVIQNTVTNVVSLLDNVMVGQVGTLQMSAVAIVNQLMFIFYLCLFGGLAGPGIFATQFFGAGDQDGLRHTLRAKGVISALVTVTAMAVLALFGEQLIGLYLAEGTDAVDASSTLSYGTAYLRIMLAGMVPYAISSTYSGHLRAVGETRLPMIASVAAILLNLFFNWVLIFGHLGAPALGVTGAAAATVLSRWAECLIILCFAHTRTKRFPFLKGVWRSFRVPAKLWDRIFRKGTPLLINEALWSSGLALLLQCYSVRGLDVVAAANIASTVSNLFNVVFLSMGEVVGIMVGQVLGAGEKEKAREVNRQLIFLSVISCLVMGGAMYLLSDSLPRLYNTEAEVRALAASFLRAVSVLMPLHAFSNCCYFTLRAGGRVIITFLFDSIFTLAVCCTTAWCLANLTAMPIVPLYTVVQALDLIKCVIGYILIKKGVWLNNMVEELRAA